MRKISKKLQLSLLLAAICISLVACNGGNDNYSGSTFDGALPSADSEFGFSFNSATETESSAISGTSGTKGQTNNQVQNIKLIRSVDMEVEVLSDKDLKPAVDDLISRTTQLGGYTSYNNIDTYSHRASANLELRIPKNQVDIFLSEVDGNYNVTSLSDRSKDVTSQYIDIESRLEVKEAAKEKYTFYLESARNVTELLEIEDRLNRTIEDIESSKALQLIITGGKAHGFSRGMEPYIKNFNKKCVCCYCFHTRFVLLYRHEKRL